MKFFLVTTSLLLLWGCSNLERDKLPDETLRITEIEPNKKTAITKQNMQHLAQIYDLTPFLFTNKLRIKPQGLPQSHPHLTLTTRHADSPHKLLAQWLHGQLHWWSARNPDKMRAAILDLKKIYPTVPTQGMKSSPSMDYAHLIICYLEYLSLEHYLGKEEAVLVITDFMLKDKIHPWTYYQVLNRSDNIQKIILKHDLVPPSLI